MTERYLVERVQSPHWSKPKWTLSKRHADGIVNLLAIYPTRKQALTTGRLLAGPAGSVRIVKTGGAA